MLCVCMCVSNQYLLAAIVTVLLEAALRLYKEGTCPVFSMLSIENFSMVFLAAADYCCSRS